MPRLIWALLCESSIIDSETNNISMISVVEQINPEAIPMNVQLPLTAVTLWEKSDQDAQQEENFSVRYSLARPGEDPVRGEWRELSIPGKKLRDRVRIQGLGVRSAGRHEIVIEVLEAGNDARVAGTIGFDVTEPTTTPRASEAAAQSGSPS